MRSTPRPRLLVDLHSREERNFPLLSPRSVPLLPSSVLSFFALPQGSTRYRTMAIPTPTTFIQSTACHTALEGNSCSSSSFDLLILVQVPDPRILFPFRSHSFTPSFTSHSLLLLLPHRRPQLKNNLSSISLPLPISHLSSSLLSSHPFLYSPRYASLSSSLHQEPRNLDSLEIPSFLADDSLLPIQRRTKHFRLSHD